MTVCGNDYFTCDSGACLNLTKRCNRVLDCSDSSDEGESCSTLMPLSPSYWKHMCPGRQKSPAIASDITSLGVNDVLMNKNQLEITLIVIIKWSDERLNFSGLIEGIPFQINTSYLTDLWRPDLVLPNGGYTDNLHIAKRESLLETVYVKATKKGENSVLDSRESMCTEKYKLNQLFQFFLQHYKIIYKTQTYFS